MQQSSARNRATISTGSAIETARASGSHWYRSASLAERGIGDCQAQVAEQHRRQEPPPGQAMHATEQHRCFGQHRHPAARAPVATGQIARPGDWCVPDHPAASARRTSGWPQLRASTNPITAPRLIPSHEAAAPPTAAKLPAGQRADQARWNRQEDVGRQQADDNAATTIHGAGGCSCQAVSAASTCSPNSKNGTIGTARTTIIGSIGRNSSRTLGSR